MTGGVITNVIPTDLDYLAPADTALTIVGTAPNFAVAVGDNITITMVDVTGNNSVRKVVVIVTGRLLV